MAIKVLEQGKREKKSYQRWYLCSLVEQYSNTVVPVEAQHSNAARVCI